MGAPTPSVLIDRLIAGIGDWRGDRIALVRRLVHLADPEVVEEWKWMGTPTWSHDGTIAIANPHAGKVKVTFAHGAHLPDPQKVFNAGLGGSEWRALDILEGDVVDEPALTELFRAAVRYNRSQRGGAPRPKRRPTVRRAASSPRATPKRS